MASKKNIHVTTHPRGGWQTKRERAERATSRHSTQHDAMKSAREQARRDGVEVVIHRPDGRIRDKDSYGNDPFPPRDGKH